MHCLSNVNVIKLSNTYISPIALTLENYKKYFINRIKSDEICSIIIPDKTNFIINSS